MDSVTARAADSTAHQAEGTILLLCDRSMVVDAWTESCVKIGRGTADVNQAVPRLEHSFMQYILRALQGSPIQEAHACRIQCARCRQQEHPSCCMQKHPLEKLCSLQGCATRLIEVRGASLSWCVCLGVVHSPVLANEHAALEDLDHFQ